MIENNLDTLIAYHDHHRMHPHHDEFIAKLGRVAGNQEKFKTIYDIGSAVLQWWREAKTAFPDSDIYCFDAGFNYEPLYKYKNIPKSNYHFGLLSKENSTLKIQARYDQGLEGVNVYPENLSISGAPADLFVEEERTCLTLDTVILSKNLPLPDLIKMDVQGSELDILLGGKLALQNAKAVILELPHVEYNIGAPTKEDIIQYMESLGFLSLGCFSNNGPDGDYYFTR